MSAEEAGIQMDYGGNRFPQKGKSRVLPPRRGQIFSKAVEEIGKSVVAAFMTKNGGGRDGDGEYVGGGGGGGVGGSGGGGGAAASTA